MCGKTVVILRKYECGCVCWRDCPTQVAICSNPCLPWHSLTPSDPRIPPLYPEKNLLKCSTVSTVTIHSTNPSYPLFPRQDCSQNKIECSRQCRAAELTGRRTAPHCAPSFPVSVYPAQEAGKRALHTQGTEGAERVSIFETPNTRRVFVPARSCVTRISKSWWRSC